MVKIFFIICCLLLVNSIYSQENKDTCKCCEDNDITFSEPEHSPIFDSNFPSSYRHDPLLEFIGANIRYPQDAIKDAIEGTVFIGFWIDENGYTSEHRVRKGIRCDLDNEALRVVKLLKFDKPAMNGGKGVGMCLVVPVKFCINKKCKK